MNYYTSSTFSYFPTTWNILTFTSQTTCSQGPSWFLSIDFAYVYYHIAYSQASNPNFLTSNIKTTIHEPYPHQG